MKSSSLRNFVLLMRVMLWERVRSSYGSLCQSGQAGNAGERGESLFGRGEKKSSSAELNRSATVGTSCAQ